MLLVTLSSIAVCSLLVWRFARFAANHSELMLINLVKQEDRAWYRFQSGCDQAIRRRCPLCRRRNCLQPGKLTQYYFASGLSGDDDFEIWGDYSDRALRCVNCDNLFFKRITKL